MNVYIIYIIIACCWYGFPWPSPATRPHHPSLLVGPQCCILYQCRAVVDRLIAGCPFLASLSEGVYRSTSLMSLYIYIYIYIYIYHPQADCFVVSQIFNVARHTGRFKLGLKPAYLYVSSGIMMHLY